MLSEYEGGLSMDSINRMSVSTYVNEAACKMNLNNESHQSPEDGVSLAGDTAQERVYGPKDDLSYNFKMAPREVVLTFDDGPNPKTTPRILQALKEHNIKGSVFFIQGQNAKRYPDLVREIVKEGQVVGNHTWDHPNLQKISDEEKLKELKTTEEAIQNALGSKEDIKLVRPPYGAMNSDVLEVVHNQYGGIAVLWQFDTEDWKVQANHTPNGVLNNSIKQVESKKNGGLMLMHDIHSNTADELPNVLTELEKRGYKFVSIENALKENNIA